MVLITDKHSEVAAYTNITNANGIVKGINNPDECELIYVNHLLSVSDEDLVLSSGQGLVFPEGFCLGQVSPTCTARAGIVSHHLCSTNDRL